VQSFTELEYLVLGLVSTVPAFVIPLLFVGKVIWHAPPTLSSDSEDLFDVIFSLQRVPMTTLRSK
jgi:hypothetical protein